VALTIRTLVKLAGRLVDGDERRGFNLEIDQAE
jgi:hypothetical protein